jgi:hypothetical protein
MASKNDKITDALEIEVSFKGDGQYFCRLSRLPEIGSAPIANISCDGQLPEHALAIALEQLASEYRRMAEEIQNIPTLAVEKTAEGEPISKCFHVTVHFEGIFRGESKFEAIHNTLTGNTVVENAKVTAIEVDPTLQVAQAEHWFDDDRSVTRHP